ncbi:hypothetical protein L0B52_02345 [Suttonella sp. R2A3]|uniref:hypothetical protein n=1 Tax=Suttonella sp. R2A3 TaxID=2908648 RepID=UPI001F176A44|nr:hypothetical protein [Suttonella sp. R2A3]UJF25002.1 hypothetical protein L0B52_02345 [Suttonella sp. R2A3]
MIDRLEPLSDCAGMTLALLGYQRWLPRSVCAGALAFDLQETTDRMDALLKSFNDQTPQQPLETSEPLALDWWVAHLSHPPLLQLTRDMSILHEAGAPEAWLLPPLYQGDQNAWTFWRSDSEAALWHAALNACGHYQAAGWFARALTEPVAAKQLPKQSIAADQWSMPESINTLWVIDGLAHHWFFAGKNTQRQLSIDWQGRQVAVRCVTHPYRCILDGRMKAQLWRDLIIK